MIRDRVIQLVAAIVAIAAFVGRRNAPARRGQAQRGGGAPLHRHRRRRCAADRGDRHRDRRAARHHRRLPVDPAHDDEGAGALLRDHGQRRSHHEAPAALSAGVGVPRPQHGLQRLGHDQHAGGAVELGPLRHRSRSERGAALQPERPRAAQGARVLVRAQDRRHLRRCPPALQARVRPRVAAAARAAADRPCGARGVDPRDRRGAEDPRRGGRPHAGRKGARRAAREGRRRRRPDRVCARQAAVARLRRVGGAADVSVRRACSTSSRSFARAVRSTAASTRSSPIRTPRCRRR